MTLEESLMLKAASVDADVSVRSKAIAEAFADVVRRPRLNIAGVTISARAASEAHLSSPTAA